MGVSYEKHTANTADAMGQTIRGKNPRGPRWFKPRSSEVRLPSRQRAEPLNECPI
jgi:hypothetical protein